MTEITTEVLVAERRLRLPLRCLPARGVRRGAVLLLHGASASSRTFEVPKDRSLAAYLRSQGADVWLLDWRGSHLVVHEALRDSATMTFDDVAAEDIPKALEVIRAHYERSGDPSTPLSVLGHCMGAGCLAMSIGGAHLTGYDVSKVVLSTLGLFYCTPWDGWLKAEDLLLERIDASVTTVHPDAGQFPWPKPLASARRAWPRDLLPACEDSFCHGLSFLFGQPYLEANLAPGIHGPELRRQFGAMALGLFMHAGQNVRRGFVSRFDLEAEPSPPPADSVYLNTAPFRQYETLLLTGALNMLWHRDSIDRMHEFLLRGGARCRKWVLPHYGHQDLLWGREAATEVFPTLASALLP